MVVINNAITYWGFFTCFLIKLFHLNYAVREQYFMIHAYSSQALFIKGNLLSSPGCLSASLQHRTSNWCWLLWAGTWHSPLTALSYWNRLRQKNKQLHHFISKTRWQKTQSHSIYHGKAKKISKKRNYKLSTPIPCPDYVLFQTGLLHPLPARKLKDMKKRSRRGKNRRGRLLTVKLFVHFTDFLLSSHPRSTSISILHITVSDTRLLLGNNLLIMSLYNTLYPNTIPPKSFNQNKYYRS